MYDILTASQFRKGDVLVNIGPVEGTRTEGAFVFVDVKVERWSPTTGTMVESVDTLFMHSTDEYVVKARTTIPENHAFRKDALAAERRGTEGR